MLYREIIAVRSEIHTKHINTLCGQNVELLNVKLVVHIVTIGLYRVKENHKPHLNFRFAEQEAHVQGEMTFAEYGDIYRL